MNRTRISLTAALLSLCLLLLRLHDAPGGGHRHLLFSGGYSRLVRGSPYVAVDGNQPGFSGGGHDLCVL